MKSYLYGVSAAALALAVASGASAQTAAPATASAEASAAAGGDVQEVVVTGSRVSRVGFVAPTPVTALSADQLKSSSAGNITEALRQLPILSASTGARGATGSAGNGGTFLNLRRLGGPRTLTLLDGRRFVPSNAQGTIDSSLFPQALISRVEIVTGGASAAYGSDAVAGVVNFILDKDFTGVKGEAMYGTSSRGDMPEYKYTLTAGTSFGGGRGHLLVSGEYFDNDGLYDLLQRENYRRGCLVINNPAGPTARTFACDVRASNANFGGLITAGALRGTTFNSNSQPIAFNFGSLTSGATQVGGDGPITQFLPLAVPIQRATLFTRASWELNDKLTAYVEANYGAAEYEYQVGSYSQTIGNTALTIFRDNAYLTPDFRARMAASNVSNFRLGRYSRDLPRTWISNLNYTTRFVGGFDADLAGVKWAGYYEHGENRRAIDAQYALNLDKYQEASDAVVAPNGAIVCRSTLTNPGNGCIPINVIGEHVPTAQQIAYVTGTSYTTQKTTEDVVALNGDAEIFQLPAGPVSLAGGVEYRKQALTTSAVDPMSTVFSVISNAQGPYRLGNYLPQQGAYHVTEGFLETVVPLVKDQPLFQDLEFNGAVRRTHYSTSGGVTTWKGGLTWRVNEILRLRGTRSRDIRAPNLNELFNAGATNRAPTFLDQFYDPPRTLSAVLNISRGNPDLKPEIADTLTFGAVLTPTFIRGLDISVDAYDIKIKGAIATVGGSQSTLDCRNGSQEACARVVRDAAGNVVTTYQQPVNLSLLKASGVDVELAYRFSLSSFSESLPGDVSLRFLGNYVGHNYTVAPGAAIVDRTGDVSQPKWRWTMSGAYRLGGLNVSAQARYTGSGPYDSSTSATDLPQRNIPGQVIVDTRVSYDFAAWGGDYQVYLNISNLFDRLPPDFTDQLPDNFDPVGRYFRAGFTFKF